MSLTMIYGIKVDQELKDSDMEYMSAYLELEECLRFSKYIRKIDKQRFLLGRVLLKKKISELLNLNVSQIRFSYSEYGKPVLQKYPDCHFSLTHSGDWICCAVGQVPVGIDIQHMEPIELDIAKNFFSSTEYNNLLSVHKPDRKDYFYDLWTIKESFIKATGKGLMMPLNAFTVRPCYDEDCKMIECDLEKEAHFYKQFLLDSEHKMAICTKGKVRILEPRVVSIDGLMS